MGRKRDNPLNLPDRVYPKHSSFYYVHPSGQWENLGKNLEEAKRIGEAYNKASGSDSKMPFFLDAFLIACEKRVEKETMAPRTCRDYRKDIIMLKLAFGNFHPTQVKPKHIAEYLDLGVQNDRPVRANREKACLSACFSWLIRTGQADITINPCIGIRRNKETQRKRYVENIEYQTARNASSKQVRATLDLVYRTLQRPSDVIRWTKKNIVLKTDPDGSVTKIIRSVQSKTGAIVDIAITPEIENIFEELQVNKLKSDETIIRRNDGRPYTFSGLHSMLKRTLKATKTTSFGLGDLKGKGATDMWLAGVPLEQIQVLCGHESVQTTEVYVKSRWRGTVKPNSVKIK